MFSLIRYISDYTSYPTIQPLNKLDETTNKNASKTPWNSKLPVIQDWTTAKFFFVNLPGTASCCSFHLMQWRHWGTALCKLGSGSWQVFLSPWVSWKKAEGCAIILLRLHCHGGTMEIPVLLARPGMLLEVPTARWDRHGLGQLWVADCQNGTASLLLAKFFTVVSAVKSFCSQMLGNPPPPTYIVNVLLSV